MKYLRTCVFTGAAIGCMLGWGWYMAMSIGAVWYCYRHSICLEPWQFVFLGVVLVGLYLVSLAFWFARKPPSE